MQEGQAHWKLWRTAKNADMLRFGFFRLVLAAFHSSRRTVSDTLSVASTQDFSVPRSLSCRTTTTSQRCAHPDYRDMLLDYLIFAEKKCAAKKALHEPHALEVAFRMYENLEKKVQCSCT